jgi:hypothetical protein
LDHFTDDSIVAFSSSSIQSPTIQSSSLSGFSEAVTSPSATWEVLKIDVSAKAEVGKFPSGDALEGGQRQRSNRAG